MEVNPNEEKSLVNRVISLVHLDEKIINDLDKNFAEKVTEYVEQIVVAPVEFLAYV